MVVWRARPLLLRLRGTSGAAASSASASASAGGSALRRPARGAVGVGARSVASMAGASLRSGPIAYEDGNIFAKILDGAMPCHTIFETEHSLAFLDAFPINPGHALLIPKKKGYATLMDMPGEEAARFLADLPRLAAAVQAATECDGARGPTDRPDRPPARPDRPRARSLPALAPPRRPDAASRA